MINQKFLPLVDLQTLEPLVQYDSKIKTDIRFVVPELDAFGRMNNKSTDEERTLRYVDIYNESYSKLLGQHIYNAAGRHLSSHLYEMHPEFISREVIKIFKYDYGRGIVSVDSSVDIGDFKNACKMTTYQGRIAELSFGKKENLHIKMDFKNNLASFDHYVPENAQSYTSHINGTQDGYIVADWISSKGWLLFNKGKRIYKQKHQDIPEPELKLMMQQKAPFAADSYRYVDDVIRHHKILDIAEKCDILGALRFEM